MVTLINATGFSWGVAAEEIGINVREVKSIVEPEFIETLPAKDNTARGKAVAPMKLTCSISGEISGALGVMAATAIAPFDPANSNAYFGAPTTGLYLQRAEVTEGRDQWKDVAADFEALAGIP